ncbi:MAG: hypothetical protein WKF77_25465 [Planctomycetaceae bacterium]
MTPAFWIYSHLAFVLLIAGMLSPLMKCRHRLYSIVLCLLIPAVIGVLPIRQTDVSGFVLGHMGTLSVSMLVLLTVQLLSGCGFVEALGAAVWRNMNLFWLISGAVLYPSALGLLDRDMYAYGFQNTMSWCVLGVSIAAVVCNYRILGLCLALSVLARQLKLQESHNLWDYLIDPWLWISAAVSLTAAACRRLFAHKRQDGSLETTNAVDFHT